MDGQSTSDLRNPGSLYAHALSLYNASEGKELEKLFAKHLKKSYDNNLWSLYVEYVKKVSTKKVSLADVYSFVFSHFEHSYTSYNLVKEYIKELSNAEDEHSNTEQIRKTYHRAFQYPKHNLGILWSEYEKWEAGINKLTSKTFIEQVFPAYSLSFNTYQRLVPYIEHNLYFKILDIELENPLKLNKKVFDLRLNFLFNFYLTTFPDNEPLLFLYSFYMKDSARERLEQKPPSVFLSFWSSFQYGKQCFDFSDKKNLELTRINHLNWTIKTEGIEAFRQRFSDMKASAGPHTFVYAAMAEYYQGNSKEAAYQTFIEAVERFPESSIVHEQFFGLFLGIGDDDNIRLLFKKLKKTESMWDLMIDYEFLHGDIEEYKTLLPQKQASGTSKEMLPPSAPVPSRRVRSRGCEGVYEAARESFGFLDLRIATSDPVSEFLSKLPVLSAAENIFSNLDNSRIIELLASLRA